jgi:hypothetical protein
MKLLELACFVAFAFGEESQKEETSQAAQEAPVFTVRK